MSVDITSDLDKKWTGLASPLTRRKDGPWSSKKTQDLIRSSIFMILTTRKGTRIMNPDFGSPFMEMVYEQNDVILRTEILNYVKTSLSEWEPRISINEVKIKSLNQDVTVMINYTILVTGENITDTINYTKFQPETVRIGV